MTESNLFLSLGKWAAHQQENFLTEAFAHLLGHFATAAPSHFASLLEQLTRGRLRPPVATIADFEVVTQLSTDRGAPDLAISGPEHFALVEVKDRSPVAPSQLKRYDKLIEEDDRESKCLVLLTRDHASPPDLRWLVEPVRWYQVSEWLGAFRARGDLDDTSGYLLDQFLGFLEGQGMAVERVSWELLSGLRQLMNLKAMMREALESAGAHRVWTSYGSEFNGVAIPASNTNNSTYFMFVRFDNPGEILFTTFTENIRQEYAGDWASHSNNQLKRTLPIDSEGEHFFAKGLASQREALEAFAKECLAETIYESPNESDTEQGREGADGVAERGG